MPPLDALIDQTGDGAERTVGVPSVVVKVPVFALNQSRGRAVRTAVVPAIVKVPVFALDHSAGGALPVVEIIPVFALRHRNRAIRTDGVLPLVVMVPVFAFNHRHRVLPVLLIRPVERSGHCSDFPEVVARFWPQPCNTSGMAYRDPVLPSWTVTFCW